MKQHVGGFKSGDCELEIRNFEKFSAVNKSGWRGKVKGESSESFEEK